jgi:hypothetical protein
LGAAAVLLAAGSAGALDVTGPWRVSFVDPATSVIGDECRFTMVHTAPDQVGGRLNGCGLGTEGIFVGTVDPTSGALALTIIAPDDPGCALYTMSGTVAPDATTALGTFTCFTPLMGTGNFTARICDPMVTGDCHGPTPPAPLSVCNPSQPATGCAGTTTRPAKLAVSRNPFSYDAKLTLTRADATSLAALGDPLTSRDYVVCLYHSPAGQPALFAAEPILAGSNCGSRPCWKSTSKGVIYRNGTGAGSQLRKLKAKAGVAGKALLKAQGALTTVAAPPAGVPLTLPVVAQVVAGDTCWSATFDSATVNTADELAATSTP